MTPDGFRAAMFELGWIALAQRALALRPAEAHALRQLVRWAGRPVTLHQLADGYDRHGRSTGSENGIRKRVERARTALRDIGLDGVIRTVVGEKAYTVTAEDVRRIDRGLLFACGVELTEAP